MPHARDSPVLSHERGACHPSGGCPAGATVDRTQIDHGWPDPRHAALGDEALVGQIMLRLRGWVERVERVERVGVASGCSEWSGGESGAERVERSEEG